MISVGSTSVSDRSANDKWLKLVLACVFNHIMLQSLVQREPPAGKCVRFCSRQR